MKWFIRVGLSTNSSSSHTVLLSENIEGVEETYDPCYWGWDFFVLKSPEAKENYMFFQMLASFRAMYECYEEMISDFKSSSFNEFFRDKMLKLQLIDLFPNNRHLFEENVDFDLLEEKIDHQSVGWWSAYLLLGGEAYVDFIRDFIYEVIHNDKIVIVGGNDNYYMDVSEKQYLLARALPEQQIYELLWQKAILPTALHRNRDLKLTNAGSPYVFKPQFDVKKEGDRKYSLRIYTDFMQQRTVIFVYIDFENHLHETQHSGE